MRCPLATVSLTGMTIEVPHQLPPEEVVGRLERFARDLARNRFPDWGIEVRREESGPLRLSGGRRGTRFSAALHTEEGSARVEVHGRIQIGGLKLRLAGGAPGVRRRVQTALTHSLRNHLAG
jgi:IS5 family transposase